MRRLQLIAGAMACAFLISACAKKEAAPAEPAAPAVDLAAEEQAIRNRSAEWMNYANAKDFATIANEVYGPEAITIYDGNIRRGSAEILAAAEKDRAESPNSVISWTTSAVKIAESGELAWETGDIYFDPDGDGKKPATTGSFVTVWEKVDGKWRAVADAGTEKVSTGKPTS